jgi:hypothetical protein
MPLQSSLLRRAIATGRGLDAFDSWVRVDGPEYRLKLMTSDLKSLLLKLKSYPSDMELREQGVTRLKDMQVTAAGVKASPVRPYLRVPLLVKKRDVIRNSLSKCGMQVIYIYDPPLDDYAGVEFATPATEQENARWWARHVLPINPMQADMFLDFVKENGIKLELPDS